jgi:hypothetical protein
VNTVVYLLVILICFSMFLYSLKIHRFFITVLGAIMFGALGAFIAGLQAADNFNTSDTEGMMLLGFFIGFIVGLFISYRLYKFFVYVITFVFSFALFGGISFLFAGDYLVGGLLGGIVATLILSKFFDLIIVIQSTLPFAIIYSFLILRAWSVEIGLDRYIDNSMDDHFIRLSFYILFITIACIVFSVYYQLKTRVKSNENINSTKQKKLFHMLSKQFMVLVLLIIALKYYLFGQFSNYELIEKYSLFGLFLFFWPLMMIAIWKIIIFTSGKINWYRLYYDKPWKIWILGVFCAVFFIPLFSFILNIIIESLQILPDGNNIIFDFDLNAAIESNIDQIIYFYENLFSLSASYQHANPQLLNISKAVYYLFAIPLIFQLSLKTYFTRSETLNRGHQQITDHRDL